MRLRCYFNVSSVVHLYFYFLLACNTVENRPEFLAFPCCLGFHSLLVKWTCKFWFWPDSQKPVLVNLKSKAYTIAFYTVIRPINLVVENRHDWHTVTHFLNISYNFIIDVQPIFWNNVDVSIVDEILSPHLTAVQHTRGYTRNLSNSASPSCMSGTSSIGSIDSPLSSSITPSLFHSRLKTFLFCKFFPP